MLTSRLKEARLRAGLSQERLGTLAGLDEMSASSRMNQYERGKHTPGFFLIERLAQALNMPTPWFYTRDDNMAELLLAYNLLPAEYKEKTLAYVRGLAADHGTGDSSDRPPAEGNGRSEPADSSTYSLSSPGQSPSRRPAQLPASNGRNRK
jgi:transcriptional regulator with XRE-family HTH domain